MDITATTRFVRLPATRARDIARAIQGQPAGEALRVTALNARKGAAMIGKTLKSAIANAENNAGLSADALVVKTATVDQGPSLKRHWPRSRGMASPILRRTSHITIVLTDGK